MKPSRSQTDLTLKASLANAWENVWFSLRTMWQLNRKFLVASGAIYVFQGLVPIAIAFLVGRLIDAIIATVAAEAEIWLPITILALLSLAQVLYAQSFNVQHYISLNLRKLFSMHLGERTFVKFQALDHNHYEDADFSKQVNKINQNISNISYAPERTLQLLTRVLQLLAIVVTIVVLSPLIVVMLLVSIVPLVLTLMRTARERWRVWDSIDHDWRFRSRLAFDLQDTRQVDEIKIFDLSGYFRSLWRKYYARTENARIRVERNAQKSLFGSVLYEGFFQLGISIWLLLKVVRDTAFSLGDFEFYRRLISDFSSASSQMAEGFQTLSESNLYLQDYKDFMARDPVVAVPRKPVRLNKKTVPHIEFKGVSLKYPGSEEYALKDISFVIEPGEDIALVGPNGAGKTTIIKLLLRFYDASEGEILINGINLKELDLSEWYRQLGVLFQQFNRYSYFKARRTIGVGDVARIDDLDGIKAAAAKAGADKYIEKLPEQYETVLSKVFSKGTDLSGGEWQRIALARAFFRDSNVLILDEPTSSVDAKAEYEIFKRIDETQQDKTTIIISHRFSTVRNANKIYVIEKGRIVESGSHQELIKEQGIYHDLFEAQAEGYR